MSSCCNPSTEHPTSNTTITIALAGNPNSGKTTIFNALTGLRQKVANYPGVTVEKKTGRCKLPDGQRATVIDLPGTYSLISRSPDEHVAMQVLRGLRPDTPAPDRVVVVVDASNLQRNLYLVSQLIELGRPLVVALNMMDVAERRGIKVRPEVLEQQLGVPVVPVVGHKKKGIHELKQAILQARVAPMPDWPLPDAMKEELLLVGGGLAILHSEENGSSHDPGTLTRYQAIAERLLIGDRADDLGTIAGKEPVASLLHSAGHRLGQLGVDPMQADIEAHYRWIENVAGAVVDGPATPVSAPVSNAVVEDKPSIDYANARVDRTLTDAVDSIFIHKVWGLLVFGAIMAALFVAIFWIADPLMGFFEEGVDVLGAYVTGWLPEGPIQDLWSRGIVKGVGAVVVFVPQIAMLFLFLSILEDSGYLARAAFLMDRLLAKVGLHGKSFIPMLSSFACAIPGVMATRTIENRKDRLATIFVAPFMSCSARLPVYYLLIGTFFASYSAWVRGGIMLSLYVLGIVAAAGTAWVFKRSLLKGPAAAFILELPTYKVPQVSQVARTVWTSTWAFIAKAGTIIFCLSVILWAMTYYPRLPEANAEAVQENVTETWRDPVVYDTTLEFDQSQLEAERSERLEAAKDKAVASEQLRYSIAGRFGQVIEPVIQPLGYDWKMGVGLVGAFAAREVFVSTMAIVYSAGDEEETEPLSEAMVADTYPDGSPVWTPLVAVSLLVWFVLAMQCMSTLAIVKRETNGWRWPLAMLVYMNGLAYVMCFAVYQIGSRLF